MPLPGQLSKELLKIKTFKYALQKIILSPGYMFVTCWLRR